MSMQVFELLSVCVYLHICEQSRSFANLKKYRFASHSEALHAAIGELPRLAGAEKFLSSSFSRHKSRVSQWLESPSSLPPSSGLPVSL